MNLETTLKGVSRSFYLSLHYLPGALRPAMKLAFLFCKAADTIADTRIIPLEKRLHYLERFRAHWIQADASLAADLQRDIAPVAENASEQALLFQLNDLFEALDNIGSEDRQRIIALVSELTQGMITDLTDFPGETSQELKAFQTPAELDRYTYYVAGCVGRFWTGMVAAHFRFAKRWNRERQAAIGETFGKGLQLVNILRDLPQDLRRGRCYLPAQSLAIRGLQPKDLLEPSALQQLRPYLQELLTETRLKLMAGVEYAAGHPWYALRLKWVVLVPMQLGFQTLELLEASPDWLKPDRVHKVTRPQVYRTLIHSLWRSLYPRLTAPAAVSSEVRQIG